MTVIRLDIISELPFFRNTIKVAIRPKNIVLIRPIIKIFICEKERKRYMVMQEKLIAEIEKRKAKDDLYRDISELEDAEKAELLTIMESVALKFVEDNFNLIAEPNSVYENLPIS